MPHALLVHELDDGVAADAAARVHGLRQVCPRANVLTAEGVEAARRRGLSVRAWGVKSLELLDRAVACGAQGATVNGPAEAAAHLLRRREEAAAAAADGPLPT